MKNALLLLITAVTCHASEFRTWTQQETGRTIEAKITEKSADHKKAKVVTRKGKVFWLKAPDLSKADQNYIIDWFPPVDHLTCRVVKTKNGTKTVRATVTATKDPVTLRIGPHPTTGEYHRLHVPKGKTITMDFLCESKYDATVTSKAGVLDQESALKKTGL